MDESSVDERSLQRPTTEDVKYVMILPGCLGGPLIPIRRATWTAIFSDPLVSVPRLQHLALSKTGLGAVAADGGVTLRSVYWRVSLAGSFMERTAHRGCSLLILYRSTMACYLLRPAWSSIPTRCSLLVWLTRICENATSSRQMGDGRPTSPRLSPRTRVTSRRPPDPVGLRPLLYLVKAGPGTR